MDKGTESSPGDKLTLLTDLPTDTKPLAGGFVQAFDVFLQRKIPLDDFRGTLTAAVDRKSVVATLRLLKFARQKNHLPNSIYKVLVSDVNNALRDGEPTQIVEVPSSYVKASDRDEEPTISCLEADEANAEQVTEASRLEQEATTGSAALITKFEFEPDDGANEQAAEQPTSIEPGSVLRDRFEILEEIGSGGMGVVYKAVDKRREEAGSDYPWIAIKVIKECYLDRPAALRALEREASKVQRLSHPNIVNVFDFDRFRERFFITMEWLDGMSLTELLKRSRSKPVLESVALRIIRNVGRGLAHAHRQGIVHADIKPNNIYLTKDQQIKLLDFGIAQAVSEENAPTTSDREAGSIAGFTPGYASCEILEGSAPTSQDDIYALGCIAYRLLAGKHAFGDFNALEAEAKGMVPEPIDDLPPGVWDSIAQILKFRHKDRTSYVANFLEDFSPRPGPSAVHVEHPAPRSTPTLIQGGIPALAIIISMASAVAWWWTRDTTEGPEPQQAAGAAVSQPLVDESILSAARLAFVEGRFIAPESENAFHYYSEVLAKDPAHAEAMAALEQIFDVFMGRFNAALGNGDIEQAMASLTAAGTVKPDDARNALASGQLDTYAAGLVEGAREATRDGSFDRAETLLEQASLILTEESDLIASARSDITSQREATRLAGLIQSANQRIDDDSLVEPADQSAKYYLAQVRRSSPNHPELARSTDRLANLMLFKVMLAISAEDYADAEYWLTEARAMNVQLAAVDRAEQQLAEALLQSSVAQEAETEQPEAGAGIAAVSVSETGFDVVDQESAGPGPDSFGATPGEFDAATATAFDLAYSTDVDGEPLLATATPDSQQTAVNEAVEPGPDVNAGGAKTVAESPGLLPISDFEIRKYVNPRMPPRSKSDSTTTGWVDVEFTVKADGRTADILVLESSRRRLERNAVAAVRRWEFVPSGAVGRTQARVPFGRAD